MDKRLADALELSKLIETANNSKRISYEKFKERTVFYKNGGRFVVNKELISFCKTLLDLDQKEAVLTDVDGDPIIIEDLDSFLKEILTIYFEASNAYVIEVKKINSQRTISGLIDL